MSSTFFQLLIFFLKGFILVFLILLLFLGIAAILSRGKEKKSGRIKIKNLNKQYDENNSILLQEILDKKAFKNFLKKDKSKKKIDKAPKNVPQKKNIYVLNFDGDIKASGVNLLREEITAIIGIAKPTDEVVLRLESPGGMVHAYGLAAAQLTRLRDKNISLTVIVDKVAASGGYLMAAIANKILAAPFAIIGSIGVIVQLPNFHRLLKDKKIDFEQLTAGSFKRTITLFGENTREGREKLHEEIEEIHTLFKNQIKEYRPQIDIDKVATGEHWLGKQAIELQLVDKIDTSDDYLLSQSNHANIYEITYQMKKSFRTKIFGAACRWFNDKMLL